MPSSKSASSAPLLRFDQMLELMTVEHLFHDTRPLSRKRKVRCPLCRVEALAQPSVLLICGDCDARMASVDLVW